MVVVGDDNGSGGGTCMRENWEKKGKKKKMEDKKKEREGDYENEKMKGKKTFQAMFGSQKMLRKGKKNEEENDFLQFG